MTEASPAARPSDRGAHGTTLLAGAPRRATDTPAGVGPNLMRRVLRHHAKGVAVITAGAENPAGFCATSLTSLSLDPPLLSFTVGLHTSSWATVESAPHVMVHLLAQGQEDIARRFGGSGPAKFGPGTRWHRGAFGLPVLDDVLGWLALAPVSRLPVGDHALVIGQVVSARHIADGGPLIHHDGGFVRLAPPAGRAW
ncbi:flavin reductase family protein [Streptomyces sp. H10-C2]|uniref:flavin reductase family protein n=1 Tax=unclassified Streptomyces TaxID=2593676 RepID=UPI0024BAA74C|nr:MULTISPECIES: flavin reductase family protein [unclassified Streptomyces]MDJ0347534.1 flavin reductase family protein [Streptomyces sp. PH10-H1]MDJ0375453.1 flavin reductase family protein [Streptomyces sp. H10-C2]